ncbi:MAG: tetratricopeptide repeat protein [bacterium]|nr:tetratricopeptide repeat protein [bacterium]
MIFQTSLAQMVWRWSRQADIAMFLNSDDATLAMEIGKHYFNGGAYDLEKAKRAFERARAIDPQLLGPRFQLGRIEFIRGNFNSALMFANEELQLHPEFDRVYYLRGLVHGYAGSLSQAAEDFQEFLKTHPKSWAAHNDLAWIYFRQGEFEKVAQTAKKGLEWNPGNTWLLTAYGTALFNLGKKGEAKKTLTEALLEAEKLTLDEWGKAYPGNNPEIYAQGLDAMRKTIKKNLDLLSR